MDELRKLYDALIRDGYYTKSFEEFQKQFQDTSYQDKVYGVVSRDGLFTKPKDDFLKQYAVGPAKPIIEPLKKKEEPTLSDIQSGYTDMASSSEGGSSVSSGTKGDPNDPNWGWEDDEPKPYQRTFIPQFEKRPIVTQDNTYVAKPIDMVGMKRYQEYQQQTKALLEQAKKEERAKAQEEEQIFKSQNLAAIKDEQFQKYLADVNANLIDKSEEEVVPELNRRFSAYGFHFEEAAPGADAMYVRTSDGKHELYIDLDPFTTATEVVESKKLRDFINLYARGKEEEKSEDYIGKAVRAQKMRNVGMRNDDGTYSTVKFASFEQDGKYFVVPTLFPKDPNATYTTNKKDWMELPLEEAIAEARKRGELFQFDNDKEAKEFAEGDWKDVNAFDIEGQKFYKEKGLDYYAEKKKYKNYIQLQDELDLIDKILEGESITPEEKMNNPRYFAKDMRRLYTNEMLEQKREEVLKKKDNLLEQVYDLEFMGIDEGNVQKTREDFDLVLGKRQNEIAGEAIKVNAAAKQEYEALNQTALSVYNVPIDKISTIVPKTPQDAENIKNLTSQLVKVKAAQNTAATKFEIAKTYYDAKWNKGINSEYEENWSGFVTSVSDAWNNGQAAEQILLLTLGVKDAANVKDRQEAARLIVENLSDVSGKQSRVLTRTNLARDGEFLKAVLSDPLEAISTLTATSLTQMLPYGSYIVSSAAAAGTAAGAAAGLAGGPFAEVTVPGGAVTGLGYGLRTGMAATMFAMEYTNSILDVMREKGYDLMDPAQVEAALSDETVWAEGGERGTLRGVPIAVVDFLSAGLAGKVFKTSKLASVPVRVGAQVAERALFDPAAEAAGEYLAQTVAGQDIDFKEIAYEALGGLGSNTSHMAVNLYKEARNNSNTALAYELTDINRVARESVSDERISQWANNMHQLGKIDADVNQRIQANVGLRREARELVSVGRASRLLGDGKKVEARVMELLAARNELSATQNRREINRNKISQINQEIATISESKKLLPENKEVAGDGVSTAVNLDAILGTTREGVSRFVISGKTLTREQFLKELDNMSNRRLLRAPVFVDNDEEAQKLYEQKVKDAIQKQSPSQVSVQSEAGVSETVEERKPETKPEVATQKDFQKEIDAIEERRKKELSDYSEDQLDEIYSIGDTKRTIRDFVNAKYDKEIADLKPSAAVTTEEVTQAEEDLVSSKTRLDELAEAIPQRIDYTEEDITNFDTLEEDKAKGIITALAEKINDGTKLTPVERSLYDANKAQVDEVSGLVAERTAIQEEVADLEALISESQPTRAELTDEQIVEYAPDEDVRDKNNDVLLKALQSKNVSPQAEPIVTDLGDVVVFEYNNFDENETRTRLTFKKKADGTIISRGVKVERSTGDIRGTDLFKNYVESQRRKRRAEFRAEEVLAETTLPPNETSDFNRGVAEVKKNAEEYRKLKNIKRIPNPAQKSLFTIVSEMMAKAYEKVLNKPNDAIVKKAYDAMIEETLQQYDFIVSKGLKVVRHTGKGEPYANSNEMLKDLRDNNTLKFLPNDVAFGQDVTAATDNIGLQPSGRKLPDGYEMTNSEVFRVVHDYFGHGILGNQFGPIGEENATLQHLDLYSDIAAPAVIYQTRGQNSWVNFSGENSRANELRKQARELKKQGKEKEANLLLEEADKIFKFAEPKIGLFPNIFNFKRYESARRIRDKQILDNRPNKRNSDLPDLLAAYSNRSRSTRGVNKRDIRETKTIRGFSLNVIAEYKLDNRIERGIKKAFPLFKGVQKIYEITDGDKYRQMMIDALKDNPYGSSATIYSAEDFSKMRLFITEDGSTGFTLREDGFLGGGFSDPKFNRPQNIAQLLILGIKEGGTTVECFDTILPDYYSYFGLKAVSRNTFNDEYRPKESSGTAVKDWDYQTYRNFNNGRPDVVFMIYDGGDRNTIEDRLGIFDEYKNYEKDNTKSFDSYDDAEEFMKQEAVKRLELDFEQSTDTTKLKEDGKKITKPGNRLFNQSIPEVSEIADRYFQGAFGRQRPQFYGTRSIDKERAKRISDAFKRLVDNPTAPNVKRAYEAMARETIEQYKFMLDAGYFVEINNEEPYGNSNEMIEDLRTNKRMKIFSTESGFGDEKITPEQRDRNVLLRESGFYDVNGQPLLVNDLFRAVHDFFGHAELGNSFGPIGEENAWNVHARMYSPLARQAMTTETRGQNSFVNFSGVNERVEAMRQEAANLRNQGKLAEAEALVGKIYEEISFAEQKQGILPEEFWTVDTDDIGDAEFIPNTNLSIDTKESNVQNGLTQQEFISAASNGNMSNATKLANFLNTAFPSVTISTDKVSFDNVMAQVGTEIYMRGNLIVYGVTVDGDIYINPDVHNSESALFNTTIHEFGHVWTDYLQGSKKGKAIYARGVEVIQEAIANDENVKKIFYAQMNKYSGDRARAINETMAILIGNKGEEIVNESVKNKFKEWLLDVWKFIKDNFKMSKDLSEEEIQNLTLDGFIQTALADIFSGSEISLTDVQKKTLKNPDAMFSSTQSMQSIIQQARANGFSDAAIKQVLLNRGFKASDINNALVVQIDVTTDLPREFANVQGGVQKGYQLFTEVRAELQRFAHMGPRGGIRRERTKTWSEIREKAIELLKANPIYQAQSDTVQMELISAFDRTLNTSANTNVTRQISAIRNNLRQRKIGAKELQQAKIAVKNLIRSVLPKSDMYSQAQINKLISIISNATEASILSDTEKVMKIVEQQRGKMKKSVLKKMIELVNKKAKPAMTTTGKRRSRGLDPEGQAFFAQVKPIIRAVINDDVQFLSDMAAELAQADADGSINEAILKQNRGEKLTTQEQALLNKAYAYDTFGDLMTMELEEVEQLLAELQDARAESLRRLKTRREVRAMRYDALSQQATAQVSELNPELFVEETVEVTLPNGDVETITVVRPKSRNELVQDRAAIRRAFQSGKIWSGFKQLVARWDYTTITGVKDFIRKRILHLGSMMNLFDNDAQGMTFFRDNVYRPLNRMDEKSKVGYFFEMANLDAMANSIPGITKGYKQIRNMLQTGIHTFTIKGQEQIYNADKLLRIYALSLNDVQREKLKQMGWDDAQIQKIKDIVGPEPIEFANKLVEYFSNDYYESINNVYSHVNDVNLGYIPNYFPTITQSQKVSAKLLEDGDFNGIFNAETAPALKERSDTSGLIELNYDFSDVVESHFVTMEKYKAYAEGVKELNAIFQNPAFNVLLEESGLKTVVKRSVNFAITPNAGQKEEQTALGKLMTKFTGFALAFKAVQVVKQATSFVNAYEDYSYFPADSRVPSVIKGPIDLMMFMVDSAKVIATMPKQVRKAYGMSANIRDRLLKGIQGDVYGLESGSNVFSPIDKRTDIWARAVRAFRTGAAGPTVLGDILGVMGYMVNYNRNIANGMSEADALEAFNDYNATAQSRRGTEKISLQQNSTELARAFTMFGSTTFLQINKVLAAQTNMFRALKQGQMPSAKDIRAFAINLGIANALFVGVSNLAKFIKGDDDDREEVLKQMGKALVGLNLIESIPLIGAAVETALADIEGEKTRGGDNVVNPYMQVYKKMKRASEEEVGFKSVQPLIEIVIGAQVDPFIGLYNGVADGFDEEAIYDLLGISKSYRPTQEKEKAPPKEKPMGKEDMKRYFPEMYEQLYGPGGALEETEEFRLEQERIEREQLKREKDLMYGYEESNGGTVWSKEKKKRGKKEESGTIWGEKDSKGGTVWDEKNTKGGTVWGEKEK